MKKISIFICLIFASITSFAQYEVKTVKRPDGITLNYFNPILVVRAYNYEASLSLYKNPDNNNYFAAIAVLFKTTAPEELNGNLTIQTTGKNGLSLGPVYNRLVNMNGSNVALSMYFLTERDINDLKSHPIKLLSFNVNEEIIALNLTENRSVLIKEFSILNKGNNNLSNDSKENINDSSKTYYKKLHILKTNLDSKLPSKYENVFNQQEQRSGNLDLTKDDLETKESFNDKARDKYKNYKLFGLMLFIGLILFLVFRFSNKSVRVNKVKSQNTSINNSLNQKQFLGFTDLKNRELMLKYGIDLDLGKNVNTERILTDKKLRFDGLYVASHIFTNRFTQELNTYISIFKFNENGLVIFTDYTEENINTKINLNMLRELKKELSKVEIYEPFEGIAKYESFQNDTIKMKFFEQNDRNNEIDEDRFFSWYGKILNDKLILSRNESFFSYDKNSVVVETVFNNIEFAFLNLK